MPNPIPLTWNLNECCHFHQKSGNKTDNYFCLKHEIQDLIDNRTLPNPNITTKPSSKKKPLLDVDTVFCSPSICVLDLKKSKNYHFLSMGLRGHPKWYGTTRSNFGAPKVPFSAKLTKMSLVNPRLTKGQTMSKFSQNNIFLWFYIKHKLLRDYWQLWPSLTRSWLSMGPKNFDFDPFIKWVETNAIANIIKFSFQQPFMGRN